MARISIIFGLLLCGLSAVAMVGTPLKMPALFIPMMFGIPVLFCGVVGLNPHRRRNSVATAAVIMTVAVVAALARCGYGIALAEQLVDPPVGDLVVPDLGGEGVDAYAANLAFATLVISSVFMVIYVVSLLKARRERRSMGESTRHLLSIDIENVLTPSAPFSGVNAPHDSGSRDEVTVGEFMSSPDP
jgi:hypothetical protein